MKKILIVEDAQLIREEIRDILMMENFKVYEAVNGLDGLESIKQSLPDLIISDISMPKLDGYGFLSELKKHVKTENIPFIFLSAKADLRDIRKGMNMGAEDYLTKPLSPDELIDVVNKKLELRWKIENKLNKFKSHITQFLPHELITPLNGILGLSEYLSEKIEIPADELKNISNSIHICGERLYRLMENYLLYSSLAVESNSLLRKKGASDFTNNETKDLITSIANNTAKYRINDLILNLENATLNFSKYFFTKIVDELIGNAIKFSISGTKIVVFSKIELDKYILQVENYGIGISEDQIDEIGAFMQFNRKITEQQGLGLGLEIVKLITELHNGEFTIDSKLDEYFKVTVELPILLKHKY